MNYYIETKCGDKIDIKLLQNKSLEIYEYFNHFCQTNQLRHFVLGGCAIGAVRNKGFIPWDDDIDVFMPRPDYEKLIKIWNKKANSSRFSLCKTDLTHNYHGCATFIKDNNTTFINEHSKNEDINHGFFIDVIPLDGCPKSKIKRIFQIIFAMIYSLFYAQRLPNNQGFFIRYLSKFILGLIKSQKSRYKIWQFCEKQMTKYDYDTSDYITELVTGLKGLFHRHPKEIFSKIISVPFENTEIYLPIGFEQYLKRVFGNYLALPAEKDRIPKHKPYFIDLNNSYKKYKGIYFCKKE